MSESKCPKCGEVFTVDESGYIAIVAQVRDAEFQKELAQREKLFTEAKSTELKLAETQAKAERKLAEANAKAEIEKQLAATKQEIEQLKATVQSAEAEKVIALKEEEAKAKDALVEKEKEIAKLQVELDKSKTNTTLEITKVKENYEGKLKEKNETIEYYKDLKTKLSTKMLGESLEQHCEIEFNRLRATGFQKAYFEKDNDSSSGSKGDYIFKETTDSGVEFISIMFEMKNEMDTTATKKKNEDFLKELDKDRKEKNCEYAVLVSLLEARTEERRVGKECRIGGSGGCSRDPR